MKQFIGDEFTQSAKLLVFENVSFPNGFAKFLEALVVEGITSEDPTRQSLTSGYRWLDEVAVGGVQLETSVYPYNSHKIAGDISIKGPKDKIEIIQSILERQNASYDGSVVPDDIELNIEYHRTLNPLLWEDIGGEYSLLEDVQDALDALGEEFFTFLDMPGLTVEDVTLTGSSANFNWNESSDMDIHLVVDLKKAEKKFGKLCGPYFDACKKVWNNLHNIDIKGIPVEFYVQDKDEVHNSTGVYSIADEEWVVEPSYDEPDYDDNDVKLKTAEWINKITEILSSNQPDAIADFMQKLSRLRQAGLDKGGEFSTENLAFKALRNGGYLDLLADTKSKIWDKEMSLSLDDIGAEEEEELSPWEELGYGKKRTVSQPVGPAPKKSRINLNVPFAHKDAAKRAGARWDAGIRKWYMLVTPDELKKIPHVWR
jgi:predicted nucleotidyltransferase